MQSTVHGIVEVEVNGIPVGVLNYQEFEQIRKRVRKDKLVWLAQGRHILLSVWAFLNYSTQAALMLAVLLPIVAAITMPYELSATLLAFTRDPNGLREAAISASYAILVLAITLGAFRAGLSGAMPDAFQEALGQRLRWRLKVPAAGSVDWRIVPPGKLPSLISAAR